MGGFWMRSRKSWAVL
jgi:hypothetical protein